MNKPRDPEQARGNILLHTYSSGDKREPCHAHHITSHSQEPREEPTTGALLLVRKLIHKDLQCFAQNIAMVTPEQDANPALKPMAVLPPA